MSTPKNPHAHGGNARWWRRAVGRLKTRAYKRLLFAIAALLLAPWIALFIAAACTKLPPDLAEGRKPSTGAVIRDRHGVLIRELYADDGLRARWIPIAAVGDRVKKALIAAEDRRFYRHLGVDPFAIVRAAAQGLLHRHLVSGASTITQQLARNVVQRPRTLRGKFAEMALAIRIEWSLSKDEILEQYLNRVSFGPGIRGVEAASHVYFDKPTADLSLAEAATLAGVPRGPSLYDPARAAGRALRRRDRVLDRMLGAGLADRAAVDQAKAEPLAIAHIAAGAGAPHLVRGVMAGAIDPDLGPLRNRTREITLTIDRGLQREIEVLAQKTAHALEDRRASAAAVVVIENATGDILAYVGSPNIEDAARLGQNDGILALRQPGSTLKPFVYELGMEKLGFTASTVLPDVDIYLPTKDGDYHPNNYDGRLHGPVRVREALANSYNIPAVWTAAAVGPGRVLDRLGELGIRSLGQDAEHYGAAIALGDGEVRLLDLTNAYATLARGGVYRPVRAVKAATSKDGVAIAVPAAPDRRVMDEAAAYVITDVLSDKNARIASFGEGNALELPFAVAAKTGTSKGFRDNYTVGFTPEVTVGVWVGNFDGSPMEGVTGVSGAGPLFHDAMIAAARGRSGAAFQRPAGLIEEAEVCSLSGERPGPRCDHRRREIFAILGGKSTVPEAECSMHEMVRIDRRNGLRAGSACAAENVEEKTFERFDAQLTAWARTAGRPVAPEAWSPLCPAGKGDEAAISAPRAGRIHIAYPPDGAVFTIDPAAAARQSIRIQIAVPAGIEEIKCAIDGRDQRLRAPYRLDWPLAPGEHRLKVEARGEVSEIGFEVR